jgi:hypothetical protein
MLKNTKLNFGSTTAIVEIKTTLARTCENTLPVEPLWVGTKFKVEISPREALRKLNSLELHLKKSFTPKLWMPDEF